MRVLKLELNTGQGQRDLMKDILLSFNNILLVDDCFRVQGSGELGIRGV
jgi:hypothetical protein